MDRFLLKTFIPSTFILLMLTIPFNSSFGWNLHKNTDLKFLYSIGYDNNILEYSDDDITKFENNTLRDTTNPESYDDLMQDLGMKIRVTSPKWLGNRKSRVYYTIKYLSFNNNSFNDRISNSFYMTQDVTKKIDLLGSYFWIPDRYLRDYYDKDQADIYGCTFAYHLYSAGIRLSPTPALGIDIRYEGSQVYYNKYFTEYDSEADGFKSEIKYKLSKSLSIKGIFKKRWSDNIGYEKSTNIIEVIPDYDAEYGDGSNGEEWFEFGVNFVKKEIFKRDWDFSLGHRIRHRYYTSEIPLDEDPFHSGREHYHQRFMLSFETDIVPMLRGGAGLEYEWRRTDSPIDRVHEVKDFDAFRFSIRLSYQVW
ncbi:MAG: hypothetical protein P9L92_20390 [Candidatus Electryonea clarkiae]|nr:hypothetical protein [Candidatus Electryonea clarkiae]MDP8288001.1 hypothetical protein [Candidatus Electryonea clarkiae]